MAVYPRQQSDAASSICSGTVSRWFPGKITRKSHLSWKISIRRSINRRCLRTLNSSRRNKVVSRSWGEGMISADFLPILSGKRLENGRDCGYNKITGT